MEDADEFEQVVVVFAGQLDDGRGALSERAAEHGLEHRRPHRHDNHIDMMVLLA